MSWHSSKVEYSEFMFVELVQTTFPSFGGTMDAQGIGGYVFVGGPFVGGLGRVYKAVNHSFPGKYFAVKLPKNVNDVNLRKRLRREADTLAAIDHPNVLKLVEQRLDHEPPFIVFEYLSGGSLSDLLARQSVPFNVAMVLLHQISGALSAFHARDGFHRDVKPDNILLAGDGSFVLADANLAALPEAVSRMTRGPWGTPGYTDPFVAAATYDGSSDIWSLGVTIAEVLTRREPSTLVDESHRPTLAASDVEAPSEKHARALVALVRSMMAPDRSLRPSTLLVQQYAAVLINGGQLPALPAPPAKAAKPRAKAGSDLGDALAAVAGVGLIGLLVVGVAAMLDGD